MVFDTSKAKGKRAVQKLKKSQAQKQVFNHIAFLAESNDKINAEKMQKETRCWNKGNWLTCMQQIADQAEYLGQVRLVW